MKFLIAMVLVILSFRVSAADREIFDLMYLPVAKTSFGFSEVMLSQGKMKDGSFEVDSDERQFKQTLGRSFRDDFYIAVQMNFTDRNFDGDQDTTLKGFSDPVAFTRVRVLDNDVTFDVLASALLSMGNTVVDGSQTNNLAGGHKASLGAQLGKKLETLQFSGLAEITRNFEGKTEDEKTKIKTTIDPYNKYLISANVLKRFHDKWFLKSQAAVEFSDHFENENDVDTASLTEYRLGLELQHLLSTNVLLRLGATLSDYHQNSVDTYRAYTMNFAANYQF